MWTASFFWSPPPKAAPFLSRNSAVRIIMQVRNPCASPAPDCKCRSAPPNMARIILIIESRENRRLLNAFLSRYHSVGELQPGEPLEQAFDLCIVDDPGLHRFKSEIEGRRDAEQPGFLPVLLVTHQSGVWARMPNLWQLVDESILTPVS